MRILTFPLLINTMLMAAGGKEAIRLRWACRNPRHSSEATLRDILTISKNTVYGREHHFEEILGTTNSEDLFRLYRQFVPANDYEALRPYVERHKQGETDVLFPGKPSMYATTSGTTNQPKWVPMTHKYLRDVYGKMSHRWIWNFICHRPLALAGKIFPIVGKECEGYAPDGTLFGSVSGVLVRDLPAIIKARYTQPAAVMSIPDYAVRNYVLMRMAMQHWNVTLWSTANPSTILELQRTVDENLNDIIDDIEQGTINPKFEVPEEIMQELRPWIKPRPERAQELRRLRDENGGKILPKQYWPELQILSTWKCGNTAVYMEKYNDFFDLEKTCYQELGYISTECRFGFALDMTNESVLFPHMHFYEFVEEHELDSAEKHYLTVDQLEQGKRYCAYVTTYSGLFRYNMNDLIEVGGMYGNCPTVHMVSKVNGIVSLTGEKLYEMQYVEAVQKAEAELQLKTKFFVGFADLQESRYDFYFEFQDQKTSQEQADLFTQTVDRYLQEINEEYASKRQSFRLKEPVGHRLLTNAYARFKAACLEDGFRDGQFKFNLLMQDRFRQSKFGKIELTDNPRAEKRAAIRERMAARHEKREERRQERRKKRVTRRMNRKNKNQKD